jgi:hypothetical protein
LKPLRVVHLRAALLTVLAELSDEEEEEEDTGKSEKRVMQGSAGFEVRQDGQTPFSSKTCGPTRLGRLTFFTAGRQPMELVNSCNWKHLRGVRDACLSLQGWHPE